MVGHRDRVGTNAFDHLRGSLHLADPRLDHHRIAGLDAHLSGGRRIELHVVGCRIRAERLVEDRVVRCEPGLVSVHALVRDDVERIVLRLAVRRRKRVVPGRQRRVGDLITRKVDFREIVLLRDFLDLVIGVDQLVGVELDLRLAWPFEFVLGARQIFAFGGLPAAYEAVFERH